MNANNPPGLPASQITNEKSYCFLRKMYMRMAIRIIATMTTAVPLGGLYRRVVAECSVEDRAADCL